MKSFVSVVGFAVALGAASVEAQVLVGPRDLLGTDSLFTFVRDLTATLGIPTADLLYVGGGSSAAVTAMRTSNRQEIAPTARTFSAAECFDPALPASHKAYAVAGDTVVNVAGSLGPACAHLNWGTTIVAQDLNGTPGVQGSVSTDLADWRTIMRIVYLGRITDGSTTQECDADLRHTILRQWGHLFKGGCAAGACTAGLRHAFRRDDASPATDTYLELLGVTASQRLTALPPPLVSPFCNGFDNQDNDPVRVPCTGTGFNGAGDEVCGLGSTVAASSRNETLGVVLPVVVASQDAYGRAATPPSAAGNCGSTSLGGAIFGNVPWTLADVQRYGAHCPNGTAPLAGACKWPRKAGSAAGSGFGCIAGKGDKPAGSRPGFDARAYNLWLRSGDGTVLAYQRNGAQVRANVSYYRIHQTGGCDRSDPTAQLGCFVAKDTCSIGFGGVAILAEPSTKALGIRSLAADGVGGMFESVALPALDDPDAAAKLARYGLNRNLYVLTWDAFANTGAQPLEFVAAQQEILDAITSGSPEVAAAATSAGLFPLPAPYPASSCP